MFEINFTKSSIEFDNSDQSDLGLMRLKTARLKNFTPNKQSVFNDTYFQIGKVKTSRPTNIKKKENLKIINALQERDENLEIDDIIDNLKKYY